MKSSHVFGRPAWVAALLMTAGVSVATTAGATELHVSSRASRSGDGSRARPFRSLARALAKTPGGATVRVAEGTYRGNLLIRGRTLVLLGGYSSDFAARSPRKHATVLLGDGQDAVLTLLAAGGTLVDGFVIKGGGGSKRRRPHYVYGGGVYVEGGHPTIADCRIEGNRTTGVLPRAEQAGGGVYATRGSLTLRANLIRANHSKRGGGVALLELRKALLEGNVISANVAEGDHGGGVYAAGKDLRFVGNLVRGNEVGRRIKYGWGGGITVLGKGTRARFSRNVSTNNYAVSLGSGYFIDDEAEVVLEGELIYRNRCAQDGGTAVFVDGLDPRRGSRARIERSTIVSHPCSNQRAGNAVRVEQGSRVEIVASVVWDNGSRPLTVDNTSRLAISRSIVQGKQVSGQGLLHAAPRFVAPERGDYRLAAPVDGKRFGIESDPTRGAGAKVAAAAAPVARTQAKQPVSERQAGGSAQPPASVPTPTAKKGSGCQVGGAAPVGPLLVLGLFGLLGALAAARRRQR